MASALTKRNMAAEMESSSYFANVSFELRELSQERFES